METIFDSKFIWGHWRLLDWNLSTQELDRLSQQVIETGINWFDHADIYGDYACEEAFGKVLQNNPSLRNEISLISKCGIKLLTDKYPNRRVKYYDYSKEYIIGQAEQSLKNLNTDQIDLLLLHRPSPFFDGHEVAEAFDYLEKSGKVKKFGVSNFLPLEFEQLQAACSQDLVTNQIEISPYNLEHFQNQNLAFLQTKGIKPMAWSPLGGGEIFSSQQPKAIALRKVLSKVAEKHNASGIDQIIYAWLLKHPSGIMPVLGTGNLERIKSATQACKINLSLEEWFEIYTTSLGTEVP
ncbi:MAG: aldo/keto reductase [Flavobacteriaceae bacterium]